MFKKVFITTLLIIAILFVGLLIVNKPVDANPSYFEPTVQTASATTSVSYMTPGTATTTLVYDTYVASKYTKTDYALLLTQFTGSSTSSLLNIDVEYSNGAVSPGTVGSNCVSTPTKCEWYHDSTNVSRNFSTTTNKFTLDNNYTYQWRFASSTVGGIALTTTDGATSTKAFVIDTPLRYVRIIYSATGDNSAIWGQLVPIKQNP